MRAERVARAAAAKARDDFAEHVGASPGDRAKNLRHRAAHAYQVVTAVKGRERSPQGHVATARRFARAGAAGAMAYRCDHDSPGCKRAVFGQRVEDESTGQLCRISSAQARDEPGFGMARERLAAKDDQSNVTQRNV